jgi:hypothetical protein
MADLQCDDRSTKAPNPAGVAEVLRIARLTGSNFKPLI